MSSVEIFIIVEGRTEQTFVRDVLAPAIAIKGLYLQAAVIGKPGHKGGKIRFDRAKIDICKFLKQRKDTYITTMFDYYGIDDDWPGKRTVNQHLRNGTSLNSAQKAQILERETSHKIIGLCGDADACKRFIPYIAMHEFEALLYSNTQLLAKYLEVNELIIDNILQGFPNPEDINDDPQGAPSKRLETINNRYRKVAMGKVISESIGIPTIRKACHHFNEWLDNLENLAQ